MQSFRLFFSTWSIYPHERGTFLVLIFLSPPLVDRVGLDKSLLCLLCDTRWGAALVTENMGGQGIVPFTRLNTCEGLRSVWQPTLNIRERRTLSRIKKKWEISVWTFFQTKDILFISIMVHSFYGKLNEKKNMIKNSQEMIFGLKKTKQICHFYFSFAFVIL